MGTREGDNIIGFIQEQAREWADADRVARGVALSAITLIGDEQSVNPSTLTRLVSQVSGVDYARTQLAILDARVDGVIVPNLGPITGLDSSRDEALDASQIDPVAIIRGGAVAREVLGNLLERQLAIDAETCDLQRDILSLHQDQ